MIVGIVIGALLLAAVAAPIAYYGVRGLRRTPMASVTGLVVGLAVGIPRGWAAGLMFALGAAAAAHVGVRLRHQELGDRERGSRPVPLVEAPSAAVDEDPAGMAPAGRPPSEHAAAPEPPVEELPFLVVSGGRVFHRDGCLSVAKLRRGEIVRSTRQQVEAMNLKPCLVCRPLEAE